MAHANFWPCVISLNLIKETQSVPLMSLIPYDSLPISLLHEFIQISFVGPLIRCLNSSNCPVFSFTTAFVCRALVVFLERVEHRCGCCLQRCIYVSFGSGLFEFWRDARGKMGLEEPVILFLWVFWSLRIFLSWVSCTLGSLLSLVGCSWVVFIVSNASANLYVSDSVGSLYFSKVRGDVLDLSRPIRSSIIRMLLSCWWW